MPSQRQWPARRRAAGGRYANHHQPQYGSERHLPFCDLCRYPLCFDALRFRHEWRYFPFNTCYLTNQRSDIQFLRSRCKDSRGNWNPNDFSIAFSVATPCDTNPPVRSNGQPTGVLATVMTNLSLATDENATCRYATVAGTDYASMVNTFSITGHGWDGPLHCGQRAREWRELQLTCGVRTPRQRQPRRLCDHLLGGGACRPVVE